MLVLLDQFRARPGLLVWCTCAALFALGIGTNNPAALFLATAGWLAQVALPRMPLCRALPIAAILVMGAVIAMGEVVWLMERGGEAHRVDVAYLDAAMPIVLTSVLATASFLRLVGGRSDVAPAGNVLRGEFLDLAVVIAVTAPCLLLGRNIGAAPFAIPGFEHMHNLVRASMIDRLSYIPYGRLNPAHNFSGDYYPRGFHLVSVWFNGAVGNDSTGTLHRWIVGYLRLFWVLWAMTILALGSATWSIVGRTGIPRARAIALVASLAGGLLILLPAVYVGVVVPGFASFAVCVLALAASVAVAVEGFGEWDWIWPGLFATTAFVVASHGWLVTAPIAGAIAASFLVPALWVRVRANAWASAVALVLAVLLATMAAARPWYFTLASGDATEQAKEPGFIEHVPVALAVTVVTGCVLGLLLMDRQPVMRTLIAPVAAAGVITFVALRSVGELDLYYSQKVLWADLLLLMPYALGGLVMFCSAVSQRWQHHRLRLVSVVVAIVTTVVAVSALGSIQNVFSAPADQVALVTDALDNADSYQLVAVGVNGEGADFRTSMWGRGGRNLRGLPALDVSEIDLSALTPEAVCALSNPAAGVSLVVATRAHGRVVKRQC